MRFSLSTPRTGVVSQKSPRGAQDERVHPASFEPLPISRPATRATRATSCPMALALSAEFSPQARAVIQPMLTTATSVVRYPCKVKPNLLLLIFCVGQSHRSLVGHRLWWAGHFASVCSGSGAGCCPTCPSTRARIGRTWIRSWGRTCRVCKGRLSCYPNRYAAPAAAAVRASNAPAFDFLDAVAGGCLFESNLGI